MASLTGNQTVRESTIEKVSDTNFSSKRVKTPSNTVGTWFKRLVGYYPRKGAVRLETADKEESLTLNDELPKRSFLSYVPFTHYDPKHKQVVTQNNERAIFLNILPADVEGLSEKLVDGIATKVKIALDALPGENEPWIVQVYQNDEDARSLIHEIKLYSEKKIKADAYQEEWFRLLEEHLSVISQRKGIFEDKRRMKWRSRYRRVRMVVYRQKKMDPEMMNAYVLRLTEALSEAGIFSSRMTGKDIWTWLMPWYSGEQENAYEFMEQVGYPEDAEINETLPSSFDLGEMCIRNRSIRNDKKEKLWHLGNRYNRFITLEPYQDEPKTGHWVLETKNNIAPFDRMPDGTVLMHTLVIDPQDKVEAQIDLVKTHAIGDGQESKQTRKECKQARQEIAKGNRLITFLSGIYIDANSIKKLNQQTTKAIAAANGAGFDVIEPLGEHPDQLILDTYVRGLPMNFDPKVDKNKRKRARKSLDSHMAKLLPLYTRGRGTQHHGINFNSTGGEPISFDPLGADRSENAHLFMIGNSGTGKTTTLITMLMHIMAAHNPRMYLITALPTFYLLGEYWEQQGKRVHRVQITESSQPSLPPFADITKAITQKAGDTNTRDYIGEAEYSARLMITQGDPKEEERFFAEHRALVKQAINFAAITVASEGREQALTEDIVKAFNTLAKDHERYPSRKEREKLAEFGTVMDIYTSGMEGELFNRPGEAWPEADVTIVEFGILARAGNEAKLAISLAGLMSMINHVVEKNQRCSSRNTITAIDEGKVFLNNQLIGPILNSIVAMWRTYGAWLWLATQNLEQIPDSAIQLVTQCEWWMGICLKDDEIDRIDKRFRRLSSLQKSLLSNTKKEMYKYSEAGILSVNLNTIIRIVPPAITLALAETEQDQKNHRFNLMAEQGITELEAVYLRADEINAQRRSFEG